ncbi:hypothetical protein HK099_004424 [Clydaea vesicula]|uniref:Sucrase/ferredoxin-like family protein n=1 Tax=Clydaea vesicula TaxID=447962 RepID=A0AAD5XYL5_9FUNG|nr:hypothetical protein HK099_004424 [Clydaea vesicula]
MHSIRRISKRLSRSFSSSISNLRGLYTSEISDVEGGEAKTDSEVEVIDLPQECIECHKQCDHLQLPETMQKKIDNDTVLSTTLLPYSRHILVSTARNSCTVWPSHTSKIHENSIIRKIEAEISKIESTYRTVLTMIDRNPNDDSWGFLSEETKKPEQQFLDDLNETEIFVLPDMIRTSVTKDNCSEVLNEIYKIKPSVGSYNLNVKNNDDIEKITEAMGNVELIKNCDAKYGTKFKSIILICAHLKRDKRCAVAYDILLQEFEKELKRKNLEKDVLVYGCSHIGGHKFAGNVIIYPQGDWYGRVKTCHINILIEEAILNQKIVKDLWRGRVGIENEPKPCITW